MSLCVLPWYAAIVPAGSRRKEIISYIKFCGEYHVLIMKEHNFSSRFILLKNQLLAHKKREYG
jgi:hypothetical protein